MADKITKFEDYKKKGNGEDFDIEIEDPYNFFNAEEREEYYRERQKDQQKKRREEAIREANDPTITHDEEPVKPAPRPEYEEEEYKDEEYDEEYDEEDYEDYKDEYPDEDSEEYDDYEDDYDGEDYDEDEEEPEGNDLMLVAVRVASIITGVVILAVLAFVLKNKVFDRFIMPDPDEVPAHEAQVSLPAGYTETDDIVVVTAEILNLRSVPSSESTDTVVAMVPKGQELKRIAQADDGSWAIVEFEGQKVYAFTKYLSTP